VTTIAAVAQLGPAYEGEAIGYRTLTEAGVVITAFTTSGVVESDVPGTFRVAAEVGAHSEGFIIWGTAGTDLAESAWAVSAAADADAIAETVIAAVTAAAQSDSITTDGTSITRRRGDSWSVALTGLGSIANRTALWLTIKRDPARADSAAILQVTEDVGAVYVAGAAAGELDDEAALTVDDEDDGDITLTATAALTATLPILGGLYYDVQVRRSTGAVETLTAGRWAIASDVTRATA